MVSIGFVLPHGVAWPKPVSIPGVPAAYDVADVVGHNDLTPENVIFVRRRPAGIIDFDLAAPSTRTLDVVTTLLWWAPLRDPVDRDPLLRYVDSARRMRVFVDAYGLDERDRGRLLDVADRRFGRSWHVMRHRAERDGGGHAWFARERPRLEAALFAEPAR